jgi:lipopolysaccharide/colanic/teichoic acid biosynthesis glycosyltransferase
MSRQIQLIIKRMFDTVVALVLLIVLSPVILAIALAIRFTSGSPVFFRWQVVGKHGQPFTGYKFRTMVVGADRIKEELLHLNEMNGGPVFKMKDDPRITPIGRLLRKYSLDELPQLWSVLKGDMSLVGPRPPLQSEFARFTEAQKQKLSVQPGMTSLWQVRGKPQDFNAWVRLDLEYIDQWSLWLDFKILVQTALVVLTGKNY